MERSRGSVLHEREAQVTVTELLNEEVTVFKYL